MLSRSNRPPGGTLLQGARENSSRKSGKNGRVNAGGNVAVINAYAMGSAARGINDTPPDDDGDVVPRRLVRSSPKMSSKSSKVSSKISSDGGNSCGGGPNRKNRIVIRRQPSSDEESALFVTYPDGEEWVHGDGVPYSEEERLHEEEEEDGQQHNEAVVAPQQVVTPDRSSSRRNQKKANSSAEDKYPCVALSAPALNATQLTFHERLLGGVFPLGHVVSTQRAAWKAAANEFLGYDASDDGGSSFTDVDIEPPKMKSPPQELFEIPPLTLSGGLGLDEKE